MSITAFAPIKNESQFIGYSVLSMLDYVDEIVYLDGNSTDGTLELLDYIKKTYDKDNKIHVFKNRDCTNFTTSYVKLFNDLIKECTGKYLFYCHPDMLVTNPQEIAKIGKDNACAYYVNMRSFANEDGLTEITKGRTNKWKTIMKNSFGLHYWGAYGHPHEDMYFDFQNHEVYRDMRSYPFEVKDSGIQIQHYCECKPRKRREEKMQNVLTTLGILRDDKTATFDLVMNHPRVHLQSQNSQWGEFLFEPRKDNLPEIFKKFHAEFEDVLGRTKAC